MNNILCIKWGDKYDNSYVEKLKEQCENNCSVPFNFYCLTDNPTEPYDIQLPTFWDAYYHGRPGFFWAYRKIYMFNDLVETEFSSSPVGDQFLFLDLDVIIHQDLKYFFDLNMDKPWIVRGWWNDPALVKTNYSKNKSTPLNSSVIRWNRGQMKAVYNHVKNNAEVIFFTYPSLDNYMVHHWYDPWKEDEGFLQGFPKGDVYSWYKGNIYPDDMEKGKLREDHKICLFNNSTHIEGDNIEEIKTLW